MSCAIGREDEFEDLAQEFFVRLLKKDFLVNTAGGKFPSFLLVWFLGT